MSKSRSRAADFAVYLAVRFVVAVVQALSPTAARGLARGLAWLAYRLDRRHRLVADDNLRQAFPNQHDDSRRDALIRAVYLHFCTVLVEIVHLPRRLNAHNWRRHVDLKDGRRFVDAMLSGRPLLLVTGHFGNWELTSFALGLLGFRSSAVARPLDNPYLDEFLRRFREKTGQQLLAKHGDFDRIQDSLAHGGTVAVLADQDAGARGLFVDFFDRPASTHKAIALLALQYRAPLLVGATVKVGEPMRYDTELFDAIEPGDYDGRKDAVKEITQRFTAALERAVRRAPEQYLWLHRRWKHQPAGRRAKSVA